MSLAIFFILLGLNLMLIAFILDMSMRLADIKEQLFDIDTDLVLIQGLLENRKEEGHKDESV